MQAQDTIPCICDHSGVDDIGPGIPPRYYPALRAACQVHGHAFKAHPRDNQCEACGLGEGQHRVMASGQIRLTPQQADGMVSG